MSDVPEAAVAAPLGPAEQTYPGKNASLAGEASSITADDRYRCRLLFEYRDVGEPVLAEKGLTRAQALTHKLTH